ncbi:MAG: hypothetical protein LBB58_04655 [Cellulomonadaceae bacterium]|jgi:hypothetical protein|nr:hypothetical protein [Cellulomonadaceae bacterium]
MSIDQDTEFLASLRGMVNDVTPNIAPLSAATVIPAARRRIAHRRSLISGAFGVVLLAGAGATQMLPMVQTPTPITVMAGEIGADVTGGEVGIAPLDTARDGRSITPATIAPLSQDISPHGIPADSEAEVAVEAVEATSGAFNPANPWTIPLITAGAAALGTGAIIAARAPKPVMATVRRNR